MKCAVATTVSNDGLGVLAYCTWYAQPSLANRPNGRAEVDSLGSAFWSQSKTNGFNLS